MNGYKSYGTRTLKYGDEIFIKKLEEKPFVEPNLDKISKLVNFTNYLLEETRNPPLKILYEDNDIAVVLKPAGVHSLQWLGPMKKNYFCLDDSLPFLLSPPTRFKEIFTKILAVAIVLILKKKGSEY